jgi:chromosome segregation ATPase
MASEPDPTEFVDTDVAASRPTSPASAAPSRAELDDRSSDVQSKLAELERRRAQLEKERTEVEEARRRRSELAHGHQEMLHHLTRGVEILQEEAIVTRRDADQMARSLTALQQALEKVTAIDQKAWTESNWMNELTKALTSVENARHEWNSARQKWPRLDGVAHEAMRQPDGTMPPPKLALLDQSFGQLCRLGFALTWPVAVAILAVMVVLLLR